MATGFDPYHRWLSIPPSEQPPHHYRLLGLQALEGCVEVIENAAERQTSHVRPHLDSPLRAYAVNLIRELDVARRCLLDPEAKAAYDSWLKQCANAKNATVAAHAPPQVVYVTSVPGISAIPAPPAPQLPNAHFPPTPVHSGQSDFTFGDTQSFQPVPGFTPSVSVYRSKYRSKRKRAPLAFLLLWSVGAVMGLLAGYAVICLINPRYDFLNIMFRHEEAPSAAHPMDANEAAAVPLPVTVNRQDDKPTRIPSVFNRQRRQQVPRVAPPVSEANAQVDPVIDSDDQFLRRNWTQSPRQSQIEIPKELPLPSLTSVDAPIMLGKLKFGGGIPKSAQEFPLELVQGAGFTGGVLGLEQKELASKQFTWNVYWTPAGENLLDASTISPRHIGTFVLIDDVLCFSWRPGIDKIQELAMRNSLLRVKEGNVTHRAALRVPDHVDAIELDLKRPKVAHVFSCSHMPEIEQIFVDITDTSSLPGHTSLLPHYMASGADIERLTLGDAATLTYNSASAATTNLSIRDRQGRLLFVVNSQFTLPSGLADDLTILRGKRKEQYLKKELVDAQARKDSGGIATVQNDIRALNEVARLVNNWKDGTRLPLRFFIEVDGHEIDLAKAGI